MKHFTPIVLLIFGILLAGCGSGGTPKEQTLNVFAASSLTDAFTEIGNSFEAQHAGVKVAFKFGSSSDLATQINKGTAVDVFASANQSQFDVVSKAGNIDGAGKVFAQNRLVVIVPVGNPAQIQKLADLAKPGIKLALAAPKVPVRDYADTMVDKLAAQPDYGADFNTNFFKNVVAQETDVRQVSAKVASGTVDAGIVYTSDVTPDLTSKVTKIPIPDEVNTIANYPIGVVNSSQQKDLARQFSDFVIADTGQNTMIKWNFILVKS